MNKQIFIHVGPPKTGSSAIQKWFNENTKTVESLGIYYPQHNSDPNGISSGNHYSIYDRDIEGNYIINLEKISKLQSDFEKSKFKYLLLSSEFFFQRMDNVKKHFPEAIFIAYLRDPMEKRESSYNQGIKRHHFTHPFPCKVAFGFIDVRKLSNFISSYGKKSITLKLYGEKYFFKKNIVSDILKTIGIELEVKKDRVNPSYQFEALEFKRWLNNYPLEPLKTKIDVALQKYNNENSQFSLMPDEKNIKQRKIYQNLLKKFLAGKEVPCTDDFLSELLVKPNKPYRKQQLTEEEFTHVCSYLLTTIGEDFSKIRTAIEDSSTNKNPLYKNLFLKNIPEERKGTIYSIKKKINDLLL